MSEVLSLILRARDEASAEVGKVKAGLGKLAGVAKAAAIAGVAALAAISGAAIKMALDYDNAADGIRVATGATGKELEALEKSFGAVARSVPDGMATVATAVGELARRTGATGKDLESLATNLLDLSRLTKTDVAANVAAATRMFGDWSVATDDQSDALDKVFRASQATGIGVDRLMEQVVQFGAPMRLLGYSLEESAALMGKWEREGVNTETAFAGLKMAVRTLADEGVKASDMGAVFRDRLEGIRTSADPVGAAIEMFGARAGPDLAAAILEGRFAIDDVLAAIEGGSDTIASATQDTRGLGEMWGQLVNTISVGVGETLAPVLREFEAWFLERMPAIQTAFAAVGEAIGRVFGQVREVIVERVIPVVLDLVQRVWEGGLHRAFEKGLEIGGRVIGWLGDLATAITDNETVMETLRLAATTIGEAFEFVADVLTAMFDGLEIVAGWIRGNQTVMAILSGAGDAIARAFGGALQMVRDLMAAIRELLGLSGQAQGQTARERDLAGPPPRPDVLPDWMADTPVDLWQHGPGHLRERRAAGGPVTARRPYLVGEAGPELFVPETTGRIVPGGGTLALTVNVAGPAIFDPYGAAAQQIAAALLPGLRRELTRQGMTLA